jgi:hypothetical protein
VPARGDVVERHRHATLVLPACARRRAVRAEAPGFPRQHAAGRATPHAAAIGARTAGWTLLPIDQDQPEA